MTECQVDAFVFRRVFECVDNIIDKSYEVCFAEFQGHLPFFYLPDVHELVDQSQDTLRVPVNHHIGLVQFRVFAIAYQFLQRRDDKGKRCAYLVRDIDEELQFRFA